MIDERLSDEDRQRLSARLGSGFVAHRLARERLLTRRRTSRSLFDFLGGREAVIAGCVRAVGLGALGRKNFLDVRIVENRVVLPTLPPAFEGFRILQLSDLHCDLEPALMDVVEKTIRGLSCDAVVLTGDYHDHIGTSGKTSLALMRRLIPLLPEPRFAILGNHDFLCRVPAYEEAGLPVLLNENASIQRGGERLHFCGVDDPRFFRTHDLARARKGIPPGSTAILLAHSPEVAAQAAALGYSFMLSGHTHGGQLCLPGGIAILRNAPIAARFLAGAWTEAGMPGYTSRGTGGSTVAARLFCPPEITLHVLHHGGI